ncbi:hypothetical protein GDO81_006368 [Engystomops pustulosus]|uniref:Uncharacterized protein n=1 Tax=Engystomops pustulosus TaxID=76066 RepID=A0AAV7CWV0_ENGPU|nr:hypothetical protein GDO81_006368 [Engystomops pustulosus]
MCAKKHWNAQGLHNVINSERYLAPWHRKSWQVPEFRSLFLSIQCSIRTSNICLPGVAQVFFSSFLELNIA